MKPLKIAVLSLIACNCLATVDLKLQEGNLAAGNPESNKARFEHIFAKKSQNIRVPDIYQEADDSSPNNLPSNDKTNDAPSSILALFKCCSCKYKSRGKKTTEDWYTVNEYDSAEF